MTRCFEVVLWFHPFVWKLRDVHNAACEEVSDAVAADSFFAARIAAVAVNKVSFFFALHCSSVSVDW